MACPIGVHPLLLPLVSPAASRSMSHGISRDCLAVSVEDVAHCRHLGVVRLRADPGSGRHALAMDGPRESLFNGGLLRSGGTEGGIRNRLDLRLENLQSGVVQIQVNTELGRPGADHLNRGTMVISPGAELTITGVAFTIAKFADLTAAGTIDVTSLDDMTVTNEGLFAPGPSLGIATIDGNFLQAPTGGWLEIEVGGLITGSMPNNHDQVLVSDTATLGGRLNVLMVDGFAPSETSIGEPRNRG